MSTAPATATPSLPSFASWSGVGLVCAGVVGLVGWHAGLEALLRGVPVGPPLRYEVALALTLAGVGLLARAQPRVLRGLALAVGLLALLGAAQLLAPQLDLLAALRRLGAARAGVPLDPVSPLSVAELGLAAAALYLVPRGEVAPTRLAVCAASLLILGLSGVLDLSSRYPMTWAWSPLSERSLIGSCAWALLGGTLLYEVTRADGSPRAHARRLGLVTGLAVLAVMFGLWQALVAQERRRLQRRVAENAARAASDVEQAVEGRLSALVRMGGRGKRHRSQARWELDAQSYLEPPFEFASVHWLDPTRVQRWSVPSGAELGPLSGPQVAETLDGVAGSGLPATTPPQTVGERSALIACAPLRAAEDGLLLGVIPLEQLFAEQLRHEQSLGFDLRWFGRAAGAPPAPRFARWGSRHRLDLAGGLVLELAPMDRSLAQGRSLLPEVTLGLGVLLALALAQMVYLAQERSERTLELAEQVRLRRASELQVADALQQLQSHTDALARANARLQEEVATRERFEQQLERQARGLKRVARRLAASNADLEQFAYVAAHDLRSPLRAIANLAQWIEEDLGDDLEEETQENLDLLKSRVERMEALLESLLTYSRAGRTKSEPEQVSLQELVDDLETLLAPPEGGIQLVLPDDLPTVETVRVPLEQALRNLLSNALKHHDREQGRVALEVEEDDDAFVFRVEDDGPGIDPKFHERVFGMFKTLRSRDRVEGSGMGLALVRRIVRRYGGTIELASPLHEDGRGTAFTVRWPKTIEDEEAEDPSEEVS